MSFCHLKNYSEYSLSHSLLRINELVDKAVENGMESVALTDSNQLFAVLKFYQNACNKGVKPIIGVDFSLISEEGDLYEAVILAMNQEGYLNLIKLSSDIYINKYKVKDRLVLKESVLYEYSFGLIILLGRSLDNLINVEGGQRFIASLKETFQDRFYLQVERLSKLFSIEEEDAILSLSQAYQIPLVATNSVCFKQKDDFMIHEARVCIYEKSYFYDKNRQTHYSEDQYFKSIDEMKDLFHNLPSAIKNSIEIAKRCNVYLDQGEYLLPNYQIPPEMKLEDFFKAQIDQKFKERVSVEVLNDSVQYQVYQERLNWEIDIIARMNFLGYFLIVMEFVQWSKDHSIPVGPGRGSGAGSLVAFVLGITELDPIEHQLLFERFLNPDRVSMPDFDIDFCVEGRDAVIQHVSDLYGKESVSQIITFGKMSAKAVIRDVVRILGKPFILGSRLTDLMPDELDITLPRALEESPDIKHLYETSEEVKAVFDFALPLEGLARNIGKHAGGVVIAPSHLTNYVPLYRDDNDVVMMQLDKDDVETIGLVKFDFLGLKTLTTIDRTIHLIKEYHEKEIDILKIPLSDASTYRLLQEGKTVGVFQLESYGMKELIQKIQPSDLEDLMALVALYRPGPLQSGMVDDFIERKKGLAEIHYIHPLLEEILKNTYGVILYQEQVMQIAQVLSDYSLAEADILRRAMGKKKKSEMEAQRKRFVEKAFKKNQVPEDEAEHIFNLIEKFSGYGFNKSHTAAYSLISYQTAWLKTHYTQEYLCACLSVDLGAVDAFKVLFDECQLMNIVIYPPDINESDLVFTPKGKHILYGLGAIKGIGQGFIEDLLRVRQEKKFDSLDDIYDRLEKINQSMVILLIEAGALDLWLESKDLSEGRSLLKEKNKRLFEKKKQKEKAVSLTLFQTSAEDELINLKASMNHIPLYELLLQEYRLLGSTFRLSFYQFYSNIISSLGNDFTYLLENNGDSQLFILKSIRKFKTGGGVFLRLIKGNGQVLEAYLGSALYQSVLEKLTINQGLIVKIKQGRKGRSGSYSISNIWTFSDYFQSKMIGVMMYVEDSIDWIEFSKSLSTLVDSCNTVTIRLTCVFKQYQFQMKLDDQYKLVFNETLLDRLRELPSIRSVSYVTTESK